MENYRNAAGCIVMNGNMILLLRRSIHETSQHGLYELPGGKLESGISIEDTAITETQEESGLVVELMDYLEPHVDDSMKKIYHGFTAKIRGEHTVVLSEEHDDYQWMTVEEALNMNAPLSHHAEFLFHQLV